MPKPVQILPESASKRWLPDYVEVWCYVPLRTLFFYLNGLVFIPSVAKLRAGDPFEGEFYDGPSHFIEMITADLEQSADSSWTEGTDSIPKETLNKAWTSNRRWHGRKNGQTQR